jgi:hypothetical protein
VSLMVLGPDHPSMLTSMANLELTYRNQRWERWLRCCSLIFEVLVLQKYILVSGKVIFYIDISAGPIFGCFRKFTLFILSMSLYVLTANLMLCYPHGSS